MSEALYVVADAISGLRSLPPGSVDLILFSPPFFGLRHYLADDDPEKPSEIGREADPGKYIDSLLDVTEAARVALSPYGSLVVELGDTYGGSGGAGGDYADAGMRTGQPKFRGSAAAGRSAAAFPPSVPLDKSLALVPESYRWSLAYGRNPFTGRTTERWRVRNSVAWCKPKPMVGELGDKFRPGKSDLAVACVAKDRYFDLDAVRTTHAEVNAVRRITSRKAVDARVTGGDNDAVGKVMEMNPVGAPPLDWWVVGSTPYAGAHYAVWPPGLLVRPILSMTPPRVCRSCGEPSRRIASIEPENPETVEDAFGWNDHWTDCGHDDWRPGLVVDPFAGSGTTLLVATGNSRNAIGFDLDRRNLPLAFERVGMFLSEGKLGDPWPDWVVGSRTERGDGGGPSAKDPAVAP